METIFFPEILTDSEKEYSQNMPLSSPYTSKKLVKKGLKNWILPLQESHSPLSEYSGYTLENGWVSKIFVDDGLFYEVTIY